MPGTNAGTGRPLSFRCSACRLRAGQGNDRDTQSGRSLRVNLTGGVRTLRPGGAGSRNSAQAREYVCIDCKHVGWSRHTDLEGKAARAAHLAEEAKKP